MRNHTHSTLRAARLLVLGLSILVVAGCGGNRRSDRPLTYSCLLQDLTNVAAFARAPAGQSKMVSSYDTTGGNNDWGRWEKSMADEKGLVELAHLKGPGCVKRIWMTSVPSTEWHFFFDGEKEARILLSPQELFGGSFPFEPPIANRVGTGYYCYVPLPFAKSLRIAVRPLDFLADRKPYFHINYQVYPRGRKVTSFPPALSPAEEALTREVIGAWQRWPQSVKRLSDQFAATSELDLPAGGSVTWLDTGEAGTLRGFRVEVEPAAKVPEMQRAKLLRELVVLFYWDGNAVPSVEAPLGDFFCNGLDRRRFAALPLAKTGSRYVCLFPMPFASGMKGVIRNDGPTAARLRMGWDLAGAPAASDRAYFHATWNSSTVSGQPHMVLRTKGQGHYVGCYLTSLGADGTWNNLEGDETMWVDGEDQPSWHGTGLEDYFNGAWYYSGLFEFPLHGLLEKAAMQTSQYRFQLPDAVPFKSSFVKTFEFGHGNRIQGYMSSTAYWYGSTPAPAGSMLLSAPRRFPSRNRVEQMAIMSELFELERVGLMEECAERCRVYVRQYPGTEWAKLLRLREAAYREGLHGFRMVRDEYAQMLADAPETPVGKQAGTLLWFHESPSNALAHAHINGNGKVFIDGRKVVEFGHPLQLATEGLTLGPGPHEITAEVQATWDVPWLRFTLRAATTNVVSGCDWECTLKKPAGWPRGDDDAGWKACKTRVPPPWMAYWQFVPNGFVNVQSGKHFMCSTEGWGKGQTLYFRKRFSLP